MGIQGSGWVVGAGARRDERARRRRRQEIAQVGAERPGLSADAVYFDAGRRRGAPPRARGLLAARASRLASEPPDNDEVVLLGYPNDGPLTAVAGTAGQPLKVFAPDAYGESSAAPDGRTLARQGRARRQRRPRHRRRRRGRRDDLRRGEAGRRGLRRSGRRDRRTRLAGDLEVVDTGPCADVAGRAPALERGATPRHIVSCTQPMSSRDEATGRSSGPSGSRDR